MLQDIMHNNRISVVEEAVQEETGPMPIPTSKTGMHFTAHACMNLCSFALQIYSKTSINTSAITMQMLLIVRYFSFAIVCEGYTFRRHQTLNLDLFLE